VRTEHRCTDKVTIRSRVSGEAHTSTADAQSVTGTIRTEAVRCTDDADIMQYTEKKKKTARTIYDKSQNKLRRNKR
jgi:hypothetical protein